MKNIFEEKTSRPIHIKINMVRFFLKQIKLVEI